MFGLKALLARTDDDSFYVAGSDRHVEVLFRELSGSNSHVLEALRPESGHPDLEGVRPRGKVGHQESPVPLRDHMGGGSGDQDESRAHRAQGTLNPHSAGNAPRDFGSRNTADDQERTAWSVAERQTVRSEDLLGDITGRPGDGIGLYLHLRSDQIAAVNELESGGAQVLEGLGKRLSGVGRVRPTQGRERARGSQ